MKKSSALSSKPKEALINSGINREDRLALSERLTSLLADTNILYLKTQSIHWNVVGPLFYSIHSLTKTQYNNMATAIDKIAERIRALGFVSPWSLQQFLVLSSIKEITAMPSAQLMIEELIRDNEMIIQNSQETLAAADMYKEGSIIRLIEERIYEHEKNAWMLRALIS